MKDHSIFFLKDWTTSPKKVAGTSVSARFRRYSTFHDQKYGSVEDFDSRKNGDIWTQTSQSIRRKRSSEKFLFQMSLSPASIQEWCLGLVWRFPEVPDSLWVPCVRCPSSSFSCVLWRGLAYSGCLAPSIVNWDGDAAKGWVAHPSSGRDIWDRQMNLPGFGYFWLKRNPTYSAAFLTFRWLKLREISVRPSLHILTRAIHWILAEFL